MNDTDSSLMSETGLRVLANKQVYFSEEEVKNIIQREEDESLMISNREKVLEDRERRQQEHRSKIRSVLSTTMGSVTPSVHLPSLGTEPWREKLRHLGYDKGTSLSREPIEDSDVESIPQNNHIQDDRRQLLKEVTEAVLEKVANPRHREQVKRYAAEELKYRMQGLRTSDNSSEDNESVNSDNHDLQEMKYWRKHLSLEDKEIENGFTTVIVLVADIIESIVSEVMDFHAFETKNLSNMVQEAVDGGRFQSAIKHLCNSSVAKVMQNPYYNALSTFASIALKNHMNQQKGIITNIQKKDTSGKRQKAVTRVKKRREYRNNRKKHNKYTSSEESSLSSENEDDEDCSSSSSRSSRSTKSRKKRKTKFSTPRRSRRKNERRISHSNRSGVSSPSSSRFEEIHLDTNRNTSDVTQYKSPTRKSQEEINELTNSLDSILGKADSGDEIVDDSGVKRHSMGNTNSIALGSMMNGISKVGPTISNLNSSVARNLEIQKQRDDLGGPPSFD